MTRFSVCIDHMCCEARGVCEQNLGERDPAHMFNKAHLAKTLPAHAEQALLQQQQCTRRANRAQQVDLFISLILTSVHWLNTLAPLREHSAYALP